MTLITLDAITLRSQPYSETSRIVTFMSRESGLVKGMAKGARGRRGRFGATLEPLQRVRVTLSVKESRDLQTVTEADLLQPYERIREDLFRSTYAQCVLELTSRLSWQEHASEEVFELLLAILHAYEEGIGDPHLLFLTYQMHLSAALGYAVDLESCSGCGGAVGEQVRFSLAEGAALCSGCYSQGGSHITLSGETAALLVRLSRPDGIAAAAALQPGEDVRRSSERLLQRYLEYHTETDLGLRSLRLAERISTWKYAGDLKGTRGQTI
ncbi:DNA repair protein RecO [Candidatus Zixiibacteriota bacterium]